MPSSFSFMETKMREEAGVIPAEPKVVKPTRNPIKAGAAPAPAPTAAKARPPVDMRLNRKQTFQAKLSHVGLDPAGHKAAQIEYWLPPEHTYEHVCTPIYWTPVVDLLKRHGDFTGSIIMVRTKDHQFYAELYVTEISMTGIHTEQLLFKALGVQADDVTSENFRWIWNDTHRGYDILRIADGHVVAAAKDIRRLQSVKDWLEKWDR